MTDISEIVARVKGRLEDLDAAGVPHEGFRTSDVRALLDAAERALALDSVGFTPSTPEVERARNAALEEAATVCDDAASMAPSTEYGGGFTDGVTWAAANIRALRSPK